MKISARTTYLILRKIYRKRVIFTLLCFYAFTLVVLLEFHLKYTKEHFVNSLDFVSRMSRSIKSLPGMEESKNIKNGINLTRKTNWRENLPKQDRRDKKRYRGVQVIENILFPRDIVDAKDDTWQKVTSDGMLFVFSAFWEMNEGSPRVRILGISGNTYLPKPYCQFQYAIDDLVTVKGKVWLLPDHHEKQFRAIFFFCGTPDNRRPVAVSVISQKQPELLNSLNVLYNDKEIRTFTVCLSPLHFNVSKHFELIQWLELSKILGVDYFLVYNHSTVGHTDYILNHYANEGWIKVIQWDIPDNDLHYFGQMAMLNDCLFRNKGISKYILNTDIDEFIVARRGVGTLHALITDLPPNICEYNFRSSFLITESIGEYAGKESAKELHLDVLLKLSRREYIFPENVRSKYIANTTCIDTAGIHFNWKYETTDSDFQRYYVMPRDALVFHFRDKPVARKGKEVKETGIYRFQSQLIGNVRKRWQKITREGKVSLK